MKQLYYRLYALFMIIVFSLHSFALGEFDDDEMPVAGGGRRTLDDELNPMDMDMGYPRLRLHLDDILSIVALIIACYVFGKIWKGCSYLIIVLAVVYYYVIR